VIKFIHGRFSINQNLKNDISAWDEFGQYLWRTLNEHPAPEVDVLFNNWETRNLARRV